MSKPRPLCELPEVLELAHLVTMLADHCRGRLPACVIGRDGTDIKGFFDHAVETIEAVGFKAEWVDYEERGRTYYRLHVTFPSGASKRRFVRNSKTRKGGPK